ncbi:hypothetical protein TcCL_Unassigned05339, partial [Trypanosoma cruzi]
TVRKLHGSGFGMGRAVCGGGAIGVPSLALVLAQVLGGGSGGISGGSDSPQKSDSRSAWERVMPWALTMCVTTLVRQLQCLPHTGQSAGHRIVAVWGPAGGDGFSVQSSLRVCCAASAPRQRHVRGMAGCSGRSSHPYS